MQGLWKDTRKHSFKDKAQGIMNRHNVLWGRSRCSARSVVYDYQDDLISIYNIRFEYRKQWLIAFPETQGLRKTAQKFVSGQTRASVRDWIQKGDWESERKIPVLEKSIAWEIH